MTKAFSNIFLENESFVIKLITMSAPCCAKLLLLVFVGNLHKYFLLSIPAFLRIGNVEYDAAHLTILIDILVSKCAVEVS